MKATRHRSAAVLFAALSAGALPAAPVLRGVGAAMRDVVERREIAGAVTMVVTAEQVLHQESTGMADLAARKPMTSEALFWIA